MQATLQEDYGVNLDNSWNRKVTESWDEAQTLVRRTVIDTLHITHTRTVLMATFQLNQYSGCPFSQPVNKWLFYYHVVKNRQIISLV